MGTNKKWELKFYNSRSTTIKTTSRFSKGNFEVSRLQLPQTVGCYYNWVRYFAPLVFCDLQVNIHSRVLPEALDVKFNCHSDQQERAG